MDQSTQLSFDFENGSISKPSPFYAFLINFPNLGIGKIVNINRDSYNIFFSNEDSIIEISESDPGLRLLNKFPKALENPETDFGSMDLSLKAHQLQLSHAFDKLSSLSNSRTRLLPHQIESTFVIANSLKPRFILADEVGLGKTIEAGLAIKELMFRRNLKKILIVAPSPLLIQWQQEMKSKFNEDFEIVRRKNFLTQSNLYWKNYNRIITSIDFIKNTKYSEEILKSKWDIVVFDEAHRLRRDYSKITRSYLFAEKISKKTECLLLLTATPFRGKLEELFYLLYLIDPNALGPYQTFLNDYVIGNKSDLKDKISKVMLRRRKVEVGGFTKRFAKTVRIELSTFEREFYEETTEYVRREYNIAMGSKNRAIGFIMIVFQKLLDSSVVALLAALQKRKFMLESKFHFMKNETNNIEDWDLDDTEGVEEIINDIEDSESYNFARIKQELFTLNRLIHLGKLIKEDRKSQKLLECIHKLKREGHRKFLIFTQFRTTQDFLHNLLSNEFQTVIFHGSQTIDEKERAILNFKEEAEVLICTEAGGEGRNLQFANVLFNYDLPWSPLKIEQRIGRIHRFGQKENVFIFNFASKDTVAERILEVLSTKIRLFEESIGASDELLGTIEEELDFNSSFMKFITGSKTKEELDEEIDLRIQVAKKGFEKLNTLVTPKVLDFNLKDYYDHSREERNWSNEHLEEVIWEGSRVFEKELPGKLSKIRDKIYKFTNSESKTKEATFDSDIALAQDSIEFLAFGHPYVDKLIDLVTNFSFGSKYRITHSAIKSGAHLFVFLVTFNFSLKRKELFYVEVEANYGNIVINQELPLGWEKVHFEEYSEPNPSIETSIIAFIYAFKNLEAFVALESNRLKKETLTLFQKEEYKIELAHLKTLRQLEEKLMRQEASLKWDGKVERKSAIQRTKNEILRTKEQMEIELRKVRNGSKISYEIELFQTYIAKV